MKTLRAIVCVLEPVGKSSTRAHRGQPRPKVGKQMRRIAAAPRGLLAPGWASGHVLTQGTSIAPTEVMRTAEATSNLTLDVPEASATKVEQPAADGQLASLEHRQSTLRVQTPGMSAVDMPHPLPPAPSLHGSFRRHRRRTASSCGSFDSASAPSTIRSRRKSQNKSWEGRRTASDLQLSKLLPYVPKVGELLLFSVMALLPFIVLGFSLVPMLFATECDSERCLI